MKSGAGCSRTNFGNLLTNEIAASPKLQPRQLIQILERLKVTCVHQFRESLVVPTQQNRTGQKLTIIKIKFLQLNKAADWFEGSYSETESE